MKTLLRGAIAFLLVASAWPAASAVPVKDGGVSGGGSGNGGATGTTRWCRDADGDGFGDPTQTREAISQPPGYVGNDADCNDADPTVYSGAPELCDGLDNNCDGKVDNGIGDADQDGIPDCVEQDDDADGVLDGVDNCPITYNPSQLDHDGDGQGDVCDLDDDGDGTPDTLDCDPLDPGSYPGAVESCDGKDNNCDGRIDEGYPDTDDDGRADCIEQDDDADGVLDAADNCPLDYNPTQRDTDGDGQGDACDVDDDQDGTPDVSDCGPLNPIVHPGAPEICDGLDNDCDGRVDEGFLDSNQDGQANCVDTDDDGDGVPDLVDNCPWTYNPLQNDTDRDGIGDACTADADGDGEADYSDCAPHDPTIFPGALEVCDGVDNNCNGEVDEGFVDQDGDGVKDCADLDDDADGVLDAADNCPSLYNPAQEDRDQDGVGDLCDPEDDRSLTGVGSGNGKHTFGLLAAWPNPTRSGTQISFEVPESGGPVRLQIFDVVGRRVAVLVDGVLPGGSHAVRWEGRYENGREAPTGIYFYRIEAPGFVRVQKLARVP